MAGNEGLAGVLRRLVFYGEGDKSAEGGAKDKENPADDKDGKNKDKADPDDKGEKAPEFTPEQQKHLDKLIGDARKEGRESGRKKAADEAEEKRQADEDAKKKADEKAEADRLAQEQKFQELSEQQAAKIAELEPEVGQLKGDLKAARDDLERHAAALKTFLDAQREGLPEHLIDLLDKLDTVEQLEYIAANADKLKPEDDGARPRMGTPRGRTKPKPDVEPAPPVRSTVHF